MFNYCVLKQADPTLLHKALNNTLKINKLKMLKNLNTTKRPKKLFR